MFPIIPTDPKVVNDMREFQNALLLRNDAQMQVMANKWLMVERTMQDKIDLLAQEAYNLSLEGKKLSPSKLWQMDHYRLLVDQAQTEYAKYATWAAQFTENGQRDIINIAENNAISTMSTQYMTAGVIAPTFDRLPVEAVQFMVGLSGDGSTLNSLLQSRMKMTPGNDGYAVLQRLVDTLISATATGQNPRVTARQMKDDLSGGLNKAMLIAQTEQMRVYRQANAMTYERSGLVEYQRRICKHRVGVCAGCLADEGTLYPANEPIPDHPRGGCTGIPVIKGMPEVDWLKGEDWVKSLPEEKQVEILGEKRYNLFSDGVPFSQFKTTVKDKVWGNGVVQTPIKDL